MVINFDVDEYDGFLGLVSLQYDVFSASRTRRSNLLPTNHANFDKRHELGIEKVANVDLHNLNFFCDCP